VSVGTVQLYARPGLPRPQVAEASASADDVAVNEPETRYAKNRDVHIAYRVVGEGPIDLASVPWTRAV